MQAPEEFKQEFPEVAAVWHGLRRGLTASPSADTLVLGSGSQSFLQSVCAKLRHHVGGKILSLYSLNSGAKTARGARPFAAVPAQSRSKAIAGATSWGDSVDLHLRVVRHADFGGATNGHHVLLYGHASGCNDRVFTPARATPKTLRHLVGSAVQGQYRPSPAYRGGAGEASLAMGGKAFVARFVGHVGPQRQLHLSLGVQ